VAQLLAWELAQAGHKVGESYLFNAPVVGDETFANKMTEQFAKPGYGPIVNVVTGKGSLSPAASYFKPWMAEVFYAAENSTSLSAVCVAGDATCGSAAAPTPPRPMWAGLIPGIVSAQACTHALAPDHDLCTAHDSQCYAGQPLQVPPQFQQQPAAK